MINDRSKIIVEKEYKAKEILMKEPHSIPAHLPKRLAISFWLWNYYSCAQEGDVYHDLEARFVELKERGFNCVRLDDGAGLCHAPDGRPRGPVAIKEPFPGHSHLIRQLSCKGGVCDVLKRLIALFEIARRHDVHVILSSWFYLHTFWFVDERIRSELFALPPEERLMYFAKDLDRIIVVLKERGLHRQIAFAEILNEVDGLAFIRESVNKAAPEAKAEQIHKYRRLHEEALAFLKGRHPDILFAVDTCSPYLDQEQIPRNAQLWNLHSYYMWSVYSAFEGKLLADDTDLGDPRTYESVRHFLNGQLVSVDDVRRSRNFNPDVSENWYRRVWLYRNVDPAKLPALEKMLSSKLDEEVEIYKKRSSDAIVRAAQVRDSVFPGIPMVMGEAATYCALNSMRWEERSETYWSLIEHTVRLLKDNGYWGCMPRTNSGPEDAAWTEFPERQRWINKLFLED